MTNRLAQDIGQPEVLRVDARLLKAFGRRERMDIALGAIDRDLHIRRGFIGGDVIFDMPP